MSWCAWQTYNIAFGMRPQRADTGDAYSGYWYEDADQPGVAIPWSKALHIPGAILLRKPRSKTMGHVAISYGDGDRTIEARGSKFGVDVFGGAAQRTWDIGVLLPGVRYGDAGNVESPRPLPGRLFALESPFIVGPQVLAIQDALRARGFDPGPLDGEFGPMAEAATISFQAAEGLEVDGIIGPQTAGELGLAFPIVPDARIAALWESLQDEATRPDSPRDGASPGTSGGPIVEFLKQGSEHSVKLSDGSTLYVGTEVPYSDDMHRRGLYQDKSLSAIAPIGIYDAADYVVRYGLYAYFIQPTIMAESAGYFGRLNSYDRAAFTFGAPQLAAHTPDQNLILLFRRLLSLPSAKDYFPELELTGDKVTWKKNGSPVDLEHAEPFKRPNGKTETQLRNFMTYLNPDPQKVDRDEVSVAARLILWTRADPSARVAQIEIMVQRAKALITRAKGKVPQLTGDDWRIAVWVFDILYQGRGTYAAISAALQDADPLRRVSQIGGTAYAERCKTVKENVQRLHALGALQGFTV